MQKLILLTTSMALLAFLGSCNGQQTSTETTTSLQDTTTTVATTPAQISEDVDAEKFKSLIDGGNGLLLDVRTPGEYEGGNIAGSVNLDINGSTFEAALDTLDKSVPVYVYCQSGGRSGRAMEMMKEKGFSEVYNLLGGYGNWPYKN